MSYTVYNRRNMRIKKPATKDGERSIIGFFAIPTTFMLIIVLAFLPASARTIYVDNDRMQYPSADYTGSSGLWDAVNNANAGDTVKVYSGTYLPPKPPFSVGFTDWVLHVNRPMTIMGVNRPVIDANGFNGVLGRTSPPTTGLNYYSSIADGLISIESPDVNINGFEFNNFSVPVLTIITVSPPTGSYYRSLFYYQYFTATPKDQFGLPITTAVPVIWNSSNPAVITINSTTGMFTSVADGITTITATSGTVSGNSTITFLTAPSSGGRRRR